MHLQAIFDTARLINELEQSNQKDKADYYKSNLVMSIKHEVTGTMFCASNENIAVLADLRMHKLDVVPASQLENYLKNLEA